MEPTVISCCLLSFLAVFILLGILALLIRLVTTVFPATATSDDAPVIAAIHAAMAASFPGARVNRIEEIQK